MGTFFNILIPVVSFDIFSSTYTTEKVLEFDYDGEEDESNSRMAALGYDTHTSIINLGSLCLYLVVYVCRLLIWLLYLLKDKLTGSTSALVKKWGETLFYQEFLSLILEAYFEWLIAGYLNRQIQLTSTFGERLSNAIGTFSFYTSFIVIPFIILYVLTRDQTQS